MAAVKQEALVFPFSGRERNPNGYIYVYMVAHVNGLSIINLISYDFSNAGWQPTDGSKWEVSVSTQPKYFLNSREQ